MTLNKSLNIALPKGRILDSVLTILLKVGIEPEQSFFDRNDRKLKFKTNINNIDINLICEKPKVSKYRKKIIISLANLLNLRHDQINLKGKTVEKLGLIGKEKAVACEVIVSIKKYD